MNSAVDQLDEAVGRLLAGDVTDVPGDAEWRDRIQIAMGLRCLPSPEFRAQLAQKLAKAAESKRGGAIAEGSEGSEGGSGNLRNSHAVVIRAYRIRCASDPYASGVIVRGTRRGIGSGRELGNVGGTASAAGAEAGDCAAEGVSVCAAAVV